MGEAKRRRQFDSTYGKKAKRRTISAFEWGREQHTTVGRGIVFYSGQPAAPKYLKEKDFSLIGAALEHCNDGSVFTKQELFETLTLVQELIAEYDPESEIVIWLPETSNSNSCIAKKDDWQGKLPISIDY